MPLDGVAVDVDDPAAGLAPGARVEPAPPVRSLEDVDVDAMLAQLAAEHTDPLLSELPGRLSSKSSKTVVIAGGIVLITAFVLVGMVVFGTLIH